MRALQKCMLLLTVLAVTASLAGCAKKQAQPPEHSPYMQQLMDAGFPQDYAALLEQLHEKHPA